MSSLRNRNVLAHISTHAFSARVRVLAACCSTLSPVLCFATARRLGYLFLPWRPYPHLCVSFAGASISLDQGKSNLKPLERLRFQYHPRENYLWSMIFKYFLSFPSSFYALRSWGFYKNSNFFDRGIHLFFTLLWFCYPFSFMLKYMCLYCVFLECHCQSYLNFLINRSFRRFFLYAHNINRPRN